MIGYYHKNKNPPKRLILKIIIIRRTVILIMWCKIKIPVGEHRWDFI